MLDSEAEHAVLVVVHYGGVDLPDDRFLKLSACRRHCQERLVEGAREVVQGTPCGARLLDSDRWTWSIEMGNGGERGGRRRRCPSEMDSSGHVNKVQYPGDPVATLACPPGDLTRRPEIGRHNF